MTLPSKIAMKSEATITTWSAAITRGNVQSGLGAALNGSSRLSTSSPTVTNGADDIRPEMMRATFTSALAAPWLSTLWTLVAAALGGRVVATAPAGTAPKTTDVATGAFGGGMMGTTRC
mmetsp:Transcript_70577/g.166431  ORF Transcript_70577/g.166431 Transcript_70577/m.166431 type:complete len:119 (-) Transcript_70577:130-486(-)